MVRIEIETKINIIKEICIICNVVLNDIVIIFKYAEIICMKNRYAVV